MPTPSTLQPAPKAIRAVRNAQLALGKPYVWGGTDFDIGVDCSGLVWTSYKMAGVQVPRVAKDQYKYGSVVPKGHEIPGDCVFSYPHSDGPGHVVLAIGNGYCIAAPHTGAVVKYEKLSIFDSVYVGTKRFIPALGTGEYTGGNILADAMKLGGSHVLGTDPGEEGAIATITSGFHTLTNPHTWYRVGQIILGAIMLFFGMNVLSKFAISNAAMKVAGR